MMHGPINIRALLYSLECYPFSPVCPADKIEYGAMWNDNWQGNMEVLGGKPLPVTVPWSTTNLNWAGPGIEPGIQRCEACD